MKVIVAVVNRRMYVTVKEACTADCTGTNDVVGADDGADDGDGAGAKYIETNSDIFFLYVCDTFVLCIDQVFVDSKDEWIFVVDTHRENKLVQGFYK